MRLAGIAEKSSSRFFAFPHRRYLEAASKLAGQIANGESFRSGDIQNVGRRLAMRKASKTGAIGIALPDHVDPAHAQVDGTPGINRARDIQQNTVTQIDGVDQTEDRHLRAPAMGGVFEQTFPPQSGLRIFSDRRHGS